MALGGEEGRRLAADELRLAQGYGAGRAIGIALRAASLLEDGTVREAGLREAVEVLARSPARLDHARTLGDLGQTLLAAGRCEEAREALHDAYEGAHRCGASALAARLANALRASGARPRRPFRHGPEALTARERRVTELAASGLTNREIADALVVTVRTVEFHLFGAFRKLGVSSARAAAGAGAPAGGG